MVKLYSVAKPLLICGYHGLTIVTMVFGFILSETTLIFVKVVLLSALARYKPVIKRCQYLSAKFLLFTIVIVILVILQQLTATATFASSLPK